MILLILGQTLQAHLQALGMQLIDSWCDSSSGHITRYTFKSKESNNR